MQVVNAYTVIIAVFFNSATTVYNFPVYRAMYTFACSQHKCYPHTHTAYSRRHPLVHTILVVLCNHF